MKGRFPAILLPLIAGCASGPEGPPFPVAADAVAQFTCSSGEVVTVAFSEGGAQLELRGGDYVLDQVRSASGARYAGKGAEFWNKGDRARLTLPSGEVLSCDEQPVASTWEDEAARGIDFRAVGQEPGWFLDIDIGRSITLTTDYGERMLRFPAPEPVYVAEEETSIWRTSSGGNDLSIRIIGSICRDAMSGKPFPSTVQVQLNGTRYSGCGRPLK